jgi:hypothetical protein
MMYEGELERAIDTASQTMVVREPSRALGPTVMARVRAASAPKPWRFRWAALSASTVLCAAIVYAVMDQAATVVIPRLPQAAQLPMARAATAPSVPAGALRDVPQIRVVAARAERAAAFAPRFPINDVSSIEAIEMQPIALAAIDVPQLERETTLVDPVEIEPLTIEPLAASND